MRRGATVTLTDVRERHRRGGRGCGPPASTLELGGHQPATFTARRPDRAQPRRAGRQLPALEAARARRRAGDRRAGAGVALAARPDRRDHRHEGQVDDDDADRADARGRRASRARRRQHRPRAERAGRRLDRRHDPRGRGEQLPARGDRDVPAVDRGAAQLLARPSRSACRRVEEYAAAKARIFVNQTADDWAVLNADDAAVARDGGGRGARDGCCSR